MLNSQFIARRFAEVLVGIGIAALLTLIIGWLWPQMALAGFFAFILFWGLTGLNTIALQQRNPDLVSSLGWKKVKTRYKPLDLAKDEYEISLTEFVRGQIASIILGIPICASIAGLAGTFVALNRWAVFVVAFAIWAAILGAGMVAAIVNR